MHHPHNKISLWQQPMTRQAYKQTLSSNISQLEFVSLIQHELLSTVHDKICIHSFWIVHGVKPVISIGSYLLESIHQGGLEIIWLWSWQPWDQSWQLVNGWYQADHRSYALVDASLFVASCRLPQAQQLDLIMMEDVVSTLSADLLHEAVTLVQEMACHAECLCWNPSSNPPSDLSAGPVNDASGS